MPAWVDLDLTVLFSYFQNFPELYISLQMHHYFLVYVYFGVMSHVRYLIVA